MTKQSSIDLSFTHSEIEKKSVKGGIFSISGKIVSFLIQVISTAILARLLCPEDFGLIAMATFGIEFFINIRDLGLASAAVQRKELSIDQLNSLFWLNAAIALIFTLALICFAPLLAWFYKEPRLTSIVFFIAFTLLFDGLSMQHRAILQRKMDFKALFVVEVFSRLLGRAVALCMAFYGFGYWSLAAIPVCISFFRTIKLWGLTKWIPKIPKRVKGIKELISFGLNVTGAQIVDFISEQLDTLLIGRQCGAYSLGIYSRAYNIMLIPHRLINWPVSSVMLPAFSAVQEDGYKYKDFFRKSIEITSMLTQPIIAFFAVCATEVVFTLLGKQWKDSILVLRILCIFGFLLATQTGTNWILISLNKTEKLFKWRLFVCIIHCASIILGIKWGIVGVALAISLSNIFIKAVEIAYCYKGTYIETKDFFKANWRSTAASVISAVALYAIKKEISITNDQLRLLIMLILFSILYLGIYSVLPGGFQRLKVIKNQAISYLGGVSS